MNDNNLFFDRLKWLIGLVRIKSDLCEYDFKIILCHTIIYCIYCTFVTDILLIEYNLCLRNKLNITSVIHRIQFKIPLKGYVLMATRLLYLVSKNRLNFCEFASNTGSEAEWARCEHATTSSSSPCH